MSMPKVSVVLPSLNVAPYIRECIESVLDQTLTYIEVICVDAGSTDGTTEILQEYAAKDDRVRLLHSDYRSYGYQVNMGIDAARGEYFAIVDTDDCIVPEMYADLAAAADEHRAEVVKSDYFNFCGDGLDRKYYEYGNVVKDPMYYGRLIDSSDDTVKFFKSLNVYNWNGIYRLDFIRKNNIRHNETKGASYQDNGFRFFIFMFAHRIFFLNKPHYLYRLDNPNSSSLSKEKIFCMCDENDFIRDRLSKEPQLEPVYAPLAAWNRYNDYCFTVNRIADIYKKDFVYRWRADFIRIKESGDLDPTVLDRQQMDTIGKIIRDPDAWLKDYFLDRPWEEGYRIELDSVSNAQMYLEWLKEQNRDLSMTNAALQHSLDALYRSRSYRLGNFVMDPIKKCSIFLKRVFGRRSGK